ncbi:MAG: DUF4838 domain-containing protein [Planctomycetota bacterium]|jgi:hypothetical protein
MQSKLRQFAGIICVLLSLIVFSANAFADYFIVKDGKAASEIIIAENPLRGVNLAALELQEYVEKITGAKLAIVHAPTGKQPFKIFIGKSSYTDAMGIDDAGLKHGAYRMETGDGFFVLLGRDFNFELKDPIMNGHKDMKGQAKYDTLTGTYFVHPFQMNYRRFNKKMNIHRDDGVGSFHAVCNYLRSLGVRWYMPGDIGEIVPKMESIVVPRMNRRVYPDYPVRRWFGQAYNMRDRDTILWNLRLGMNSGYEVLGAGMHVHGMRNIMNRKEMFEAHPEYYALYGGKRHSHHACFKSEGLFQETLKYARLMYDHFDEPHISLWPNDGYLHCQCDLCKDVTPSEAVWGFANKVATELYKTHPDRYVSGGGYTAYLYPPENLKKFSPNFVFFLAAHRPGLDEEERWNERQDQIARWTHKLGPQRLIRNANNYYRMVIHPRSFARELKELKNVSLGDWGETRMRVKRPIVGDKVVMWQEPGITHLNQYVNARMLWDADRDIEDLLDEYYKLYYGPAGPKMKIANDFAEAVYVRKGRSYIELKDTIRYFELVREARARVGDSVYGRRVQMILDELEPLEKLKIKLKEEVKASMRPNARLIVGKDAGAGEPEGYEMVDLKTGEKPGIKTTVKVQWKDSNVIFNIRCDDPDMANLFVTEDIWGGDSVGILLETDEHKYYQMEINPNGKIVSADREFGKVNLNWDAKANVEVSKGKDHWTVKVTIPVLSVKQGGMDPLHNVIGSKPTQDSPWYIFVGRVRLREGGEGEKGKRFMNTKQVFGLSKTGGSYHSLKDFAKLEIH